MPGHWQVSPPRTGFPQTGGSAIPWVVSDAYDANANPQNWGYVDFRHFRKAVSVMADGHTALFTPSQLRDMRHWSNKATRADWNFTP